MFGKIIDLLKGATMGTVTVNGKTYVGNDLQIINGKVLVDGREVDNGLSGVVEVRVLEGTIGQLKTDASVTCQNVTGNIDAGGSVTVKGDVGGKVDAGGSVNCGDVGQSVDAGVSVNCGAVQGNVDAGGSVIRR